MFVVIELVFSCNFLFLSELVPLIGIGIFPHGKNIQFFFNYFRCYFQNEKFSSFSCWAISWVFYSLCNKNTRDFLFLLRVADRPSWNSPPNYKLLNSLQNRFPSSWGSILGMVRNAQASKFFSDWSDANTKTHRLRLTHPNPERESASFGEIPSFETIHSVGQIADLLNRGHLWTRFTVIFCLKQMFWGTKFDEKFFFCRKIWWSAKIFRIRRRFAAIFWFWSGNAMRGFFAEKWDSRQKINSNKN